MPVAAVYHGVCGHHPVAGRATGHICIDIPRQAGHSPAAMAAIIDVILPIFAIMLAGIVAARTRLLKDDASEALSQFVYYAAGPALAFIALYRTPVDDFLNVTTQV